MPILLLGAKELHARMDALKTVFQPAGRKWAEDTQRLASQRVPVRTGRTKASIRIRTASKTRATVVAQWGARFIEGDTKAHTIVPKKGKALKFAGNGRTVFSRKAERRAHAGRPFLRPSAQQALDMNPLGEQLVASWNGAAP